MPIFKEIPAAQTGHVPVKVWTDNLEASAEQQLTALAGCPFVFHHVAAMPDVHYGLGATIGSVFATENVLLPTAVGVDIGCGVLAQPFNVRAVDLSTSFLRELHEHTKREIPTGFGQHQRPQEWDGFGDETRFTEAARPIVRDKAPLQLGSLGGGNHFLELCRDEQGMVWLMLHSGSRGAGNMIAQHHIEIARALNERLGIPSAKDLWVLPLDSVEGQSYRRDMLWAQDYAMENRSVCAGALLSCLLSCCVNACASSSASIPTPASISTTTTPTASRPSAARYGFIAKAPPLPAAVCSASFPARWPPARTSFAGSATPSRFNHARTAPAG